MSKKNCIVIDAGTATTIDYIDDKFLHKGGIILPSKGMVIDAFSNRLRLTVEKKEDTIFNFLNNSTHASIESGATLCAYNNINYLDEFGPAAFLSRARSEGLRDFGCTFLYRGLGKTEMFK